MVGDGFDPHWGSVRPSRRDGNQTIHSTRLNARWRNPNLPLIDHQSPPGVSVFVARRRESRGEPAIAW